MDVLKQIPRLLAHPVPRLLPDPISRLHPRSAANLHFIAEVFPNYFHLFPNKNTPQDLNMKIIGRKNLLFVKCIRQKEGSRFKVIYTKNHCGQVEVINRLKITYQDKFNIWQETKVSEEVLQNYVYKQRILDDSNYEYKTYWVHTFLNGRRMFPIIINNGAKTFYNACALFKQFIPEDDLGILIDDEKELTLNERWKPEEIDYRSSIRLCPTCGTVSNTAKSKKDPWLNVNDW